MSTHSPIDEGESYDGGEGKEEEGEKGKDEDDKGGEDEEYRGEDDGVKGEGDMRAFEWGSLGSPGDGHTCPFILPKMWTVNDFKLMMTTNTFKNLQDRFQIPDHILIRLPEKFESATQGRPQMSICSR